MKYAVYIESSNKWEFCNTEQEVIVRAYRLVEKDDDDEESENPLLFCGGIKIFKLIKEGSLQPAKCSQCLDICKEGCEDWGRIEFKDVKNESFELFKEFATDPAFAKYRASNDTAGIIEIAKNNWEE